MEYNDFFEQLGSKIIDVLRENDLPYKIHLVDNEVKGMVFESLVNGKQVGVDFKPVFDSWENEDLKDVAVIVVESVNNRFLSEMLES